ncbi:MAG TPA: dihydroorotase [Candidatus Binatia bacterium]|nr:dihydroorotase [Candidatus Binatia bacterium]
MLISQARIVNEGRIVEADVLVQKGRIERIAPFIAAPPRTRVVDARGKLLLPGVIDDQVHFREPGFPHKGDIASESAAAVAGGTTSFMEMPNTDPKTVTRELLKAKYQLAEKRAHANYAFYFGATNDNLAEIERLAPGEACGVKIFMGASTGNMLVDDPATLESIFAKCPTLIATHCESTPRIKAAEAAARAKYGEDVPAAEHAHIRDAQCCYESSSLAVGLARKHGANLHVLHLTTARELALFQPGDRRITAEACVHHLFLDESAYATLGHRAKCNPSIKTAADRQALVQGVKDGRITLIATDHAPHTADEKAQSYFKAPSGLPVIQHSLLMMLELVQRGELDLKTVVHRMCHAPAERFGVQQRGYVREGWHADLVLVDPKTPTKVTAESLLYRCGWSPFEGQSFSHSIAATWVNGEIAWESGKLAARPHGKRLEFGTQP